MPDINTKIRETRIRKGYTLTQLAGLAGLTKGYLSKIEHGAKVPPVSTLLTIAHALGTDLSEFFNKTPHGSPAHPDIDIVRKKMRETNTTASSAGYAYQVLVGSLKNKYMSPFLLRIEKGTTDFLAHDSEELLFVLQGTIELWYENKAFILKEGDSAYFDSRKKHRFRNTREKDALILSVNFDYRRF